MRFKADSPYRDPVDFSTDLHPAPSFFPSLLPQFYVIKRNRFISEVMTSPSSGSFLDVSRPASSLSKNPPFLLWRSPGRDFNIGPQGFKLIPDVFSSTFPCYLSGPPFLFPSESCDRTHPFQEGQFFSLQFLLVTSRAPFCQATSGPLPNDHLVSSSFSNELHGLSPFSSFSRSLPCDLTGLPPWSPPSARRT